MLSVAASSLVFCVGIECWSWCVVQEKRREGKKRREAALTRGSMKGDSIKRPEETGQRMRSRPNIIVTGTPGVGKSLHAQALARGSGLAHLCINDLVKQDGLHEGWSDEYRSYIVDDERVVATTLPLLQQGGQVIDWHICDVFPLADIDLVCVLRTDHSILYDRLQARGYAPSKLEENMDAEIMEVVAEEARGAYHAEQVVELRSEDEADLRGNIERLLVWIADWEKDNEKEFYPEPRRSRQA